nr:MAG TPA: hypothetical protein [Caudoviricetes sp.]
MLPEFNTIKNVRNLVTDSASPVASNLPRKQTNTG